MMSKKNSELTVPAKVFEYVRACRPILAFTRPGSAPSRLLAQSGIPHTCIDPGQPLADIDAGVLSFFRNVSEDIAPSKDFLEVFDAGHQTEALHHIISGLCDTSCSL